MVDLTGRRTFHQITDRDYCPPSSCTRVMFPHVPAAVSRMRALTLRDGELSKSSRSCLLSSFFRNLEEKKKGGGGAIGKFWAVPSRHR